MVLATVLSGALSATGCSRALSAGVPEVVFFAPLSLARSGTQVHVAVEVARTAQERARGLMFRRELASGHGMLFLFPEPAPLKFWMRNTYIPLDMIFFGADHRVVFIEENATPLTDTPRGPDTLTQFVLEVPGGWARARGLAVGAEARFRNL